MWDHKKVQVIPFSWLGKRIQRVVVPLSCNKFEPDKSDVNA